MLDLRYALTLGQCGVVAVFAVLYLYLSYVPLFHAVTWHHTLIGQWIWEHRELPAVDPTQPLADGMAWTTTSWLSDVALAMVEQHGGLVALSATLSIMTVASQIILAAVLYQATGRKRWMMLGWLVCLICSWPMLGVLRPETFATVCLVVLLALLPPITGDVGAAVRAADKTGPGGVGWPTWLWFALPALMLAWANLDGSVVVGVAILAADAVGCVVDRWLDTRRLRQAVAEPLLQKRVALVETAILATLLTPLGPNLWGYAAKFPDGPLWSGRGVGSTLPLFSFAGLSCVLIWIAAVVLLRFDRQRWAARDVLLLIGGTLVVAVNADRIGWFAVVAAVVLIPHAARLFAARGWIAPSGKPAVASVDADSHTRRVDVGPLPEISRPLPFVFSLIALLIVWVAFSLSPLATPLLGGKPRSLAQMLSRQTPLAAAAYVKSVAPHGLIWAPEQWGDWLAWDGPPGIRLAANSNAHVLPRQVRADYASVYRAEGNWTRILDRYGVEYLILDKTRHDRLRDAALEDSENWSLELDSSQAMILKRKESHE